MKDEIKNKSESLAMEKSFAFALRIVKLYQHLADKKKEFVLSKQVLRSGTSIGANLEESRGAQSSSDFQAKISIAYKEARETSYWLRLLHASKYLTDRQFNSVNSDCEELVRILGATQLTMKTKIQQKGK
ncbi:MAG: four helix bundle protein [Lentisphaeria bacterium]|nr:four helix bundle protein [Lentisphaeria bacterium]